MSTLFNLILIAAFAGMIWALAGKFFDRLSVVLSKVLSYAIPAIFFGVLLSGAMFSLEFLGFTRDYHLFGYHPFWVAFVPCLAWEILKGIIRFCQSR